MDAIGRGLAVSLPVTVWICGMIVASTYMGIAGGLMVFGSGVSMFGLGFTVGRVW